MTINLLIQYLQEIKNLNALVQIYTTKYIFYILEDYSQDYNMFKK